MVTLGGEGSMKIWDIRKLGQDIYSYFAQGSHLAVSQKALLAVGDKNGVSIWKVCYIQIGSNKNGL